MFILVQTNPVHSFLIFIQSYLILSQVIKLQLVLVELDDMQIALMILGIKSYVAVCQNSITDIASHMAQSMAKLIAVQNMERFQLCWRVHVDQVRNTLQILDCTQYNSWQCYVCHCNLAVHITAKNSNSSQTVLHNVSKSHVANVAQQMAVNWLQIFAVHLSSFFKLLAK